MPLVLTADPRSAKQAILNQFRSLESRLPVWGTTEQDDHFSLGVFYRRFEHLVELGYPLARSAILAEESSDLSSKARQLAANSLNSMLALKRRQEPELVENMCSIEFFRAHLGTEDCLAVIAAARDLHAHTFHGLSLAA